MNQQVQDIERLIAGLESELQALRLENESLKRQLNEGDDMRKDPVKTNHVGHDHIANLSPVHIERYSRQLLMSNSFGRDGQLRLINSKVLVIGAGGIGSTLLLYLAGAGVGHVTIVDFDVVEVSNLHRQIIHKIDKVGTNKAESARSAMLALNDIICVQICVDPFSQDNAKELVQSHDCVVDCSDNPMTRYLANDACVLANRPLISGSAIGTEGQLAVYNYSSVNDTAVSSSQQEITTTGNSACYRCLYPYFKNNSGSCQSCNDAGVLGPVPGIIGVLQSVEVLKVLTKHGQVLSDRMLLYSSLSTSFMTIKRPPKRKDCPVCSDKRTILTMKDSHDSLTSQVTPGPDVAYAPPQLPDERQISCREYYENVVCKDKPHILLDVRVSQQYDLCKIEHSRNVSLEDLHDNIDTITTWSRGEANNTTDSMSDQYVPIYCMCRRGIRSAVATSILHVKLGNGTNGPAVYNIVGGLDAWRIEVDPSFPRY